MDRHELERAAAEISWFHTMDLGHGVVTRGAYDPAARLDRLAMPDDLRGLDVLDVGAWDGFYAFEAKRRGARRVVATDSYSWGGAGWGSKDGFELARRALGSEVEDADVDVLELDSSALGEFDLVLFLGVLYHMRHPLLALERVAGMTRRQLIVDTHVDVLGSRRPMMAFYPDGELNNDVTSWCGPNPAAVRAMLESTGFREVRIVWTDSIPYRLARAVDRARRHERGLLPRLRSTLRQARHGRLVAHAFR